MDLRKVLFVGGDPEKFASVKIRCVDIARQLGCDCSLGEKLTEEHIERYAAFVCVKPMVKGPQFLRMAKQGLVIWDIIDALPPKDGVAFYLASTTTARELFSRLGRVELIPHQHCNYEGATHSPKLRRPSWIGSRHWQPKMEGFDYDFYNVDGMQRADVVRALQKTGIGLNLRIARSEYHPPRVLFDAVAGKRLSARGLATATKNLFDFHLAVNSGIKLLNCLGFGIPSLSGDEPAYHEFGEDCTIFSTLKQSAKWVKVLQEDDDLYTELRTHCLQKAGQFHIDTIAGKYKALLQSL